jgi:hypothetical protein
MSYIAEQCVAMSWLVHELAHWHKAMTAAQKLEELRHRRGVFMVFVNKRNLNMEIIC